MLVAEDNLTNQKVVSGMLTALGYRTEVVPDGAKAVEALSNGKYAAVLMDVQMPEMDGYEATKEIRRRELGTGRHVPIIAMTANALERDREKALSAGMDDYLPKPVKREQLGEVLKRWVSPQHDDEPGKSAPLRRRDTSADEPAVDPEVIAELRELQNQGSPGLLGELIKIFLREVSTQLSVMEQAVEEGDAKAVRRVAHTLKGSSGNMGAKKMKALSGHLQGVGVSGDLSHALQLIHQLKEEFGEVRQALKAELRTQ